MTITIYTIRIADHYRLGDPAIHVLEEPGSIDRTWIDRTEYELPSGYTAAMCQLGTLQIYNASGHHCPLADSLWAGQGGGSPVLVDSDASPWRIKLTKVRDLPW